MKFEDFKTEVSNLSQHPIGNLERKLIAELAGILGWEVPNCTCHDRFQDLLVRLGIYCKNKSDFFKYEMARGCIIEYAGKKYSQITCSNEIAAAYIKANPLQKVIKVPFDDSKNVEAVETIDPEDEIVTIVRHVCGKNGCRIVTKKKKRSELTAADKKVLEQNEKDKQTENEKTNDTNIEMV